MPKVLFKRKTTEEIEELPTEDGSFIVDTKTGKTYIDTPERRIQIPGSETPLIDENGTPSNTNTYNASAIKEMACGTVLWTNPKPTSEFAQQDVSLNSNDYDILEIYFRTSLSDNYVKTSKCYKGIGTMLDYVMPNNARVGGRRVGYTDDLTLGFDDAYYNGTLNNSACIPLYIIGYKTRIFD